MSIDDSDIAFAVDLFSGLGGLTKRKMFGGMCLYRDGTVFALLSSTGRIYLKTKDPAALYGQETEQFHTMPYWALPEDALDDPETAVGYARAALSLL
ncbi:TfoX/Sxy family protein [Flavimaricola marinus]|uniref:TfoX N-terminal domain-containing protein n=1 Tax=Flavimaricola marinus TaxID=1819565 RepID=A0A238LE19_9RHOB|nr:TfoX/Sxy family protein [Flavimaricola marinus]SMY07871.1 hypothetical protein LOM8899_02011 [Flavimaricola marinus]